MPGDWVNVEVGSKLTLRAPPGTVFRTRPGKDSFTGSLEGPGFALLVDYGALRGSSAALPAVPPGCVAESILIDNKPARIVLRQSNMGPDLRDGYSVGLEVSQLSPPGRRPLSLSITGRADDPDRQLTVRSMFTTIRFRARP